MLGKSMNTTEHDQLIVEIKNSAKTFTEDNILFPTEQDYIIIESAMLLGASIVVRFDIKNIKEKL